MIKTEKLNKTYDRHRRNANHVLKDVTLELPETGFVCILGPSGCGKTSLLNALGGLDKFDNGTLTSGDCSVNRYGTRRYENRRNRDFGYIFQNYYLLPEHSVAYNIYLGLHSLKLSHREKVRRIRQALEAVGMGNYIRRKVGELSGGQQQRIAIARALARRPRVIFADEPTGNLDESNTMNICSLLRQISKESLVIMVTHEERIARFFADRIITLTDGCVSDDRENWQRDGISTGTEGSLYAGDYEEARFDTQSVSLRVLQETDAAPVEVTVVALKDRILIKLADGRAITCGAPQEAPALKEGKRPVLTLETLEQEEHPHMALFQGEPAPQGRAGSGVKPGLQLREAVHLAKGGGAKRASMRIFLILLTVLTVWSVCDYLTVSSVDPRDFVTSDSHTVEIALQRGSDAGDYWVTLNEFYVKYSEHLLASGLDVDILPSPITPVTFSAQILPQLQTVSASLSDFSYVYLDRLDESTLIYGRMPETSSEIVVDTWVLENLIANDDLIKNAMSSVSFFLNQPLEFSRCNVEMTIVGICDSGEPSVYLSKSDYLRLCSMQSSVMTLSAFQALYPGLYDDLTLSDTECILNPACLGSSYYNFIGHEYQLNTNFRLTIKDAIGFAENVGVVVNDAVFDRYICLLASRYFSVYGADKQALLDFFAQPLPDEMKGVLVVDVKDDYTDARNAYLKDSQVRIDGRVIVTLTVMLLSMVMLYLLCRSQVQERIGMLAVYRLLGIPKQKLYNIFAMESALSSLRTTLPVTALVWLVIQVLNRIEDLNLGLVLSWQAALAVFGGLLAYHLLVSLFPLRRLLRMPPATLAAKYDF